MDTDKVSRCLVEMGDSAGRVKVPRRTIFFASGETMEEFSTDEEDTEEPVNREVIASKLTWAPYFWFHMWRMGTSTISGKAGPNLCDYMGERLASLFGITSPKYQYAIDEYYRIKKERCGSGCTRLMCECVRVNK
uniref:Family with sequence similarity 177 member A1 n=1 Tax=Gasterosteus aculeatus aculeatus TaxID=481459 RepID=A0AAQ4RA58_GASAC